MPILGNAKVGYGNTVPMFNESKKMYGVWNVENQAYEPKTTWDDNPNTVIERFDDLRMGKTTTVTASVKAKPAKAKIVRERGGDKAAIVAAIVAANPGRKIARLILECEAKMSGVSAANWRYLISKAVAAHNK